jgi:hypothetical protein
MPSRGQEFRLQVNSLRSIWATCCARIFSRHDLVVGPNARLRRRPRKDDGEIHAAKARRGGCSPVGFTVDELSYAEPARCAVSKLCFH